MKWVNENGIALNPQPTALEVAKIRLDYAELFLSANKDNASIDKKESRRIVIYLLEAMQALGDELHGTIDKIFALEEKSL